MKTPIYVRKAVREYEKRLLTKGVKLHIEKDRDLIELLDADPEPFNPLVKRLLRAYYQSKHQGKDADKIS